MGIKAGPVFLPDNPARGCLSFILTPPVLPPRLAWVCLEIEITFNEQGHERDDGGIQFRCGQPVGPVVSGRILGRNKVLLVSDE